jgi:hypothetical protein
MTTDEIAQKVKQLESLNSQMADIRQGMTRYPQSQDLGRQETALARADGTRWYRNSKQPESRAMNLALSSRKRDPAHVLASDHIRGKWSRHPRLDPARPKASAIDG